MAKGSRGGKRNSIASGMSQPVLKVNTISQLYNSFNSMDDDEKADVIKNMISQDVPDHLANNDFQKFIYNIGLNDKPDIVDDKTFDNLSGKTVYRTVNSVYNSSADIGYKANQIALQVQTGRVTRVSDTGGSVYGRGIYFADDKSESARYGNTRGDITETAQIRSKFNSNAKIITYNNASNGAYNEIKSGSKLGKILSRCDSESRSSIYAMSKGYNVIEAGNGYYNILNRQAVTMSKTIKPI